jgi:phage/conjugal plasmid C-4 type zinc finger TraR family protein
MAYYSEQEMRAIREALTRRLEGLIEGIRAGLSDSEQHQFAAILGQTSGDSSDEALATSLADVSAARIDLDVRQWRELEDAKRRLDGPDFGECLECGNPIPVGRLVANPAARRCTECQNAFERTHAGQPHGSL